MKPSATQTAPASRQKLSANPHVVVLNYTGDRDNWGCQATSRELLKLLTAAFVERGVPRFTTVPLLAKGRRDKFIKPILSGQIEQGMLREKPSLLQKLAMDAAVKSLYREYLPALRRADYVVFQAEGTLTADFYMNLRLLLLPYYAKVVLGKPVFSLNQTLYAADERFSQVLRSALSTFDLLAVREPASLDFARQIGINHCRLIPDAAFNTSAAAQNPLLTAAGLTSQQYLCVSGSAVINSVSQDDYHKTILRAAERHGLAVVLLGSAAEDRRCFERLRNATPPNRKLVTAPLELSYEQVAAVLRDARLLLSGRFHMAVLASTVATPVVLLGTNTFKNDGLLALLKYPLPVRSFAAHEQIAQDIEHVLEQRAELSAGLARARQDIAALAQTGRSLLAAAIEQMDHSPQSQILPTTCAATSAAEKRSAAA